MIAKFAFTFIIFFDKNYWFRQCRMCNTKERKMPIPVPTKTEDQVVIHYTQLWFSETSWSADRFASELLVPLLWDLGLDEAVQAATAVEYENWKRAKGVQVGRVIRGTQKFPLAWKWAWIACLPEKYRQPCRQELLAIAGVMDIPLPSVSGTSSVANLSRLTLEFSQVLNASAPAQDGKYDEHDSKELTGVYIDELVDLVEAAVCELQAVTTGTGHHGRRRRIAELTGML
ncbi:hypothetical protein, partial [Shewanella algae]